MKAATAHIAEPAIPSSVDQRIELGGQILDRLDICRRLLRDEKVTSRLALALQLLERTADDVAELAGRP